MKHLISLLALLSPMWVQAGELKLELHAPGMQGKMVYVALYSIPDTFMTRDTRGRYHRIAAAGDSTILSLIDLPAGRYAISAYIDVNGNGKLDTNFIGIPNEPTGFSRDASSRFGPPDFNEAAFDIDEGETTHTIHLQ